MKKDKKIEEHEYKLSDVKRPSELIKIYEQQPEPKFLWGGIEDVSFGYVFGPSKVGKTIFCENLGISMAVGKNSFFNQEMSKVPKKVFMAAMEEDYRNRTRRMMNQMKMLNSEEKILLDENYILAGMDFPRFLHSKKDWLEFEEQILIINPQVVIIDSLTRILSGDITNREECKKVLARLRNFAYRNSLCLIIIHHATKISGRPLTMDSMAGSSVLSQEADFSIGMNRNEMTNTRYLKEVFYRYKSTGDLVTCYEINEVNWVESGKGVYESSLILDNGEKYASNYDKVISFLENKAYEKLEEDDTIVSYKIKSSEMKKKFVESNTMPSRTFDYTLKNVVAKKILIQDGSLGNYIYDITQLRKLRNIDNDDIRKNEN